MFYALGSVQVSATPYLLTLLISFAACVVVIAAAMVLDSDADTWLVRAGQQWRLSRTRMSRMLRRRGVSVMAYARDLTLPQLKEQIEVCTTCGLVDLCDRALGSRTQGRSAFSFCPNRPSIERHLFTRLPLPG